MSSRKSRLPAYRSIRFRLAALFVSIFGTTLIFFSILLFQVFARSQQSEFDATLYNLAIDVADGIDVDFFGDLSLQSNALSSREKIFPFHVGRAFVQVQDFEGKVVARSRNLARSYLKLPNEDRDRLARQGAIFKTIESKGLPSSQLELSGTYRLIVYLISKPGIPRLILQIAVPTAFLDRERLQLVTFFLVTIPLTLVLASLGGLYLSNRALLPVIGIIEKAQEIGASRLSDRLPVPEVEDEIRQLAVTLNELLDRLQRAFESQERFIADASHQLKTPLAILRGELDVISSRARSPEEVAEFLSSASQEISHLSKLVEDLLLLARMDAGHGSLSIQEVRIDEVVIEAVSRLEPLAAKKSIKIGLNLTGEAAGNYEVKGDGDLLQCMFHNLVENALKYSPQAGKIDVTVADLRNEIVVEVQDQGPGIQPELLDSIFNRFYRAKSGVPGVGLGLPIARRIAEVHGGSLEARSTPGEGSCFTVRIKKV